MIDSDPSRSRDLESDRPKTVLYVDDHAIHLMLMRALLSHRPAWRLNMACDAEAACMIARNEPHDLLLLDLNLPDGSGIELLRRLREMPGLSEVPAVLVTSDEVEGLSATGFCELWPKPLNMRHTLSRLDHFLGDAVVVPAAEDVGVEEAPVAAPVIQGAGCTPVAAMAGRLLDLVKSQTKGRPQNQVATRLPALRPAS